MNTRAFLTSMSKAGYVHTPWSSTLSRLGLMGLLDVCLICLESLQWPYPVTRLLSKGDTDGTCASRTLLRHVVVVIVVANGYAPLCDTTPTAKGQKEPDGARPEALPYHHCGAQAITKDKTDVIQIRNHARKKKKPSVSIDIMSLNLMTKRLNRKPCLFPPRAWVKQSQKGKKSITPPEGFSEVISMHRYPVLFPPLPFLFGKRSCNRAVFSLLDNSKS